MKMEIGQLLCKLNQLEVKCKLKRFLIYNIANFLGLSKPSTADFSSQVDDGNLLETSTSIGVGLRELANAINRYCDMVERNF